MTIPIAIPVKPKSSGSFTSLFVIAALSSSLTLLIIHVPPVSGWMIVQAKNTLNFDSVFWGALNVSRSSSDLSITSKRRVKAILVSSPKPSGFSKAFCMLPNKSPVSIETCRVRKNKNYIIKPNIIQFYLSDWFLLCTIRFMLLSTDLDFQSIE